ncbi:heavy-metal-associated domain-containing protein [Mycoplana ramosa]|uniref:Heavy-metal-associated domain-containing protein n=1 Tax=Mycoplana ramosa TaxID=40837 RepID=A0ABW3YY49_MYCRA
MKFHVEDMTCGGCAKAVTSAILSLDAKAKVTADPITRKVEVETAASRVEIEEVLIEAGYPAKAA